MGLFDPFKDVKDGVLLDKEDIVAEEEAGEEQDADDVNVYTAFHLFSSLLHTRPPRPSFLHQQGLPTPSKTSFSPQRPIHTTTINRALRKQRHYT